jgi:hypothetical protein
MKIVLSIKSTLLLVRYGSHSLDYTHPPAVYLERTLPSGAEFFGDYLAGRLQLLKSLMSINYNDRILHTFTSVTGMFPRVNDLDS